MARHVEFDSEGLKTTCVEYGSTKYLVVFDSSTNSYIPKIQIQF